MPIFHSLRSKTKAEEEWRKRKPVKPHEARAKWGGEAQHGQKVASKSTKSNHIIKGKAPNQKETLQERSGGGGERGKGNKTDLAEQRRFSYVV